jgi:uncharacterized protein
MQNVIGTPARGNKFYPRPAIVKRIVQKVLAGNNLQISAPRRIGKTSILYYLLDNKVDGHSYVFADTGSFNNAAAFYKKLLQETLKSDAVSKSQKLTNAFAKKGNRFLSKIKSIKILGHGLDLHEYEGEANYYEDFCNLLCGFAMEEATKLVIMVDEFPQTIQNIADAATDVEQGRKNAIQFLQENRSLRTNPDIINKAIFVYTGSIGLTHTVSALGGTAFINDLNSVEVPALQRAEAVDLLKQLLGHYQFSIEEAATTYLLDKIEWLIPFHIQLAVQEIELLLQAGEIVTPSIIDKSFNTIVDSRNNNHFDHYYSRLKTHFKGEEFVFANDLLQWIAVAQTIEKGRIYDLSVKYKLAERCKGILETLVYDGYINNNDNVNLFRFNSPVVRMWWVKNICK